MTTTPHRFYVTGSLLCVAHSVLTSCYALRELYGHAIIVPLLLFSLLAWFTWPFVIWRSGVRGGRFVFPILAGFVLLFPAFFYAMLDLTPWRM
jgi:hypothetical protein